MSNQRTHYVTTTDGVTIGATVHGQGPPLVLLHGATGDGDLDWQSLVPHLEGRFTCHLPSMRGRGLSDQHPDLRLERVVDDYLTYVHSIGEPTGLVGWSAGANHALAIASESDVVSAVAPYEPIANSQMDDEERAVLGAAIARTGELAADGDLTGAVRAFLAYPFTDDDLQAAEGAGYFDAAARHVPHMLRHLELVLGQPVGPLPDDPAVLGAIAAPVLVLHGSVTTPFNAVSARHVADHVADARTREVPGAGHAAPLTHPEALATALTEFFSPSRQPA